jgi:GxxExxY protein
MTEFLCKQETYRILGCCFEVYKEKGCGFLEPIYQECLELEMRTQEIPFVPQRELNIFYKGVRLQQKYKPDLLCFETVIVELKAVRELAAEHRAQVINYLRATGLRVALLVNFCHYPKLEYERFIV